jgi:hypothetical protein
MTRQIRLTVETARKTVTFDLASKHPCNERIMTDVFSSPAYYGACRSQEDTTVEISANMMVERLRESVLCASIMDIQNDDPLRASLIMYRDAVLDASQDPSLKLRFAIGYAVCAPIDEEALRLNPDRYVSPLRQQELIELADSGQGASAVRLAIRETAAAFRQQLHLH